MIDIKYNMDVSSEIFVMFLRWYKEVYGNEHIEDFDTASIIIDIVEKPFKFQTEYIEFIKLIHKQDEGK